MRLDELPDSDLRFLLEAVGADPFEVGELRARQDRIEALAADPRTYRRLGIAADVDPLLRASPALVFLVLLSRTVAELGAAVAVDEEIGSRERVPVFDTAALRDFAGVRPRRLFLVDLLTSYTRVESGSTWQRTGAGWRRRRYSDLDPVHVAELLGGAAAADRPRLCRRLGDLALFLAGVFPDHVLAHPLEPREVLRLTRALETTGEPVRGPGELVLAAGGEGPRWLMEWLAGQAYAIAARLTPSAVEAELLGEVAARTTSARRILDQLTRHHLAPLRARWFGVGGG